jgi:hypothetical protein
MAVKTLGDLDFGEYEAASEVVSNNQQKRAIFDAAFVVPPGIDLDEYRRGERYFVTGRKGTGKTALLRYLHSHFDQKNTFSHFIVFNNDIQTREKEGIFKSAGIVVNKHPDLNPSTVEVVDGWLIYMIKELTRLLERNSAAVTGKPALRKLLDASAGIRGLKPQSTGWTRLFRRGASMRVAGLVDVKLDRDTSKEATGPDSANDQIRLYFDLLSQLRFKPEHRFFLLFDELNFVVTKGDRNERDTILVRDLIKATERFNRYCFEHRLPIHVLCAIRSEVIDSVFGATHELRKAAHSYGREITWHKHGARKVDEHPFMRLVESRINACEKSRGLNTSGDVWATYFPEKINGSLRKSFVYANTWARPRDLVSLLGDAASASPEAQKFDTASFNKTAPEHSKYAWDERVPELAASYDDDEIGMIKAAIVEIGREFDLKSFEEALLRRGGKAYFKDKPVRQILRDLYNLGVIGQMIGARSFRWAHEGYRDIDFVKRFRLHRSLFAEFVADKVTDADLEGDDGD